MGATANKVYAQHADENCIGSKNPKYKTKQQNCMVPFIPE